MVPTHPTKGISLGRKNEIIKRITTPEELEELKKLREIGKTMELKDKMEKVNKENKKNEEGSRIITRKKLNHLGFPHADPYGLSEAFWKIFTKPEVK